MPEQEAPVTLISDGSYSGTENHELAASKNIELVSTDLTGREVDPVWGGSPFMKTEPKLPDVRRDIHLKTVVTSHQPECAECPLKEANVNTVHGGCTANRRFTKGSLSLWWG